MKCTDLGGNTEGESKGPGGIDVPLGKYWSQTGLDTRVVFTAEREDPSNPRRRPLCLKSTAARLKLKGFGGGEDLTWRVATN